MGSPHTRRVSHTQYLGNGLLVFFGWPTAREDDAERAVRAGGDGLRKLGRHDDALGTLGLGIAQTEQQGLL